MYPAGGGVASGGGWDPERAHLLRRHGVSRAPGCTGHLARYIGERPLQLGGRRVTADERGSIATQYKRDEVELERPRGVDVTPEPGLTRRVRPEPECSVQAHTATPLLRDVSNYEHEHERRPAPPGVLDRQGPQTFVVVGVRSA